MIILDTNVLSQLARDPGPIAEWMARNAREDLHITATTVTEIIYGLERLPAGRRREALERQWQSLEVTWRRRVLDITREVAHIAGRVLAVREALGRRLALADAQIAGAAIRHGAVLATRNTRDFDGLGIDLVDPWQ